MRLLSWLCVHPNEGTVERLRRVSGIRKHRRRNVPELRNPDSSLSRQTRQSQADSLSQRSDPERCNLLDHFQASKPGKSTVAARRSSMDADTTRRPLRP